MSLVNIVLTCRDTVYNLFQLFPVIDSTMVEPLRIARDRYEDMKEKNSMPPVCIFYNILRYSTYRYRNK